MNNNRKHISTTRILCNTKKIHLLSKLGIVYISLKQRQFAIASTAKFSPTDITVALWKRHLQNTLHCIALRFNIFIPFTLITYFENAYDASTLDDLSCSKTHGLLFKYPK